MGGPPGNSLGPPAIRAGEPVAAEVSVAGAVGDIDDSVAAAVAAGRGMNPMAGNSVVEIQENLYVGVAVGVAVVDAAAEMAACPRAAPVIDVVGTARRCSCRVVAPVVVVVGGSGESPS